METHSRDIDLRFKLMNFYYQLDDDAALQSELDFILSDLVDPQNGSLLLLQYVPSRYPCC